MSPTLEPSTLLMPISKQYLQNEVDFVYRHPACGEGKTIWWMPSGRRFAVEW
jgi:hypothetical protein